MTYLYLFKGDTTALVDTCVADTPEQVLVPALAEIGMKLSDVDLILNTHCHVDHTGGNASAKRLSGARIHLHTDDLDRAQSVELDVEYMNAPYRILGASPQGLEQRAKYLTRNSGEAAGADALLAEGEVIDLGRSLRLRVIHNPGHTPGSISYFWESEGVLICGDAVQGLGARAGAYPYYNDAPTYRRSLTKISGVGFQTLCVAHPYFGGSFVNNPVRSREDAQLFLAASMKAADDIHTAVAAAMRRKPEAGPREIALDALAELIFLIPQLPDRDLRIPRSAPGTLVAHIEAVRKGSYAAP
jgi:hydroxyacylglutathione hydrolase